MKHRRPHGVVRPIADDLLSHFREQGLICELGGSMRRQAPTVGDVDIVILCESLDDIVLPDWLEYSRCGSKVAHGQMDLSDGAIGVDLWACRPEQWGAFLWYITGSKELNVVMRRLAMSRGLKLSQFGVFRDGVQIDDGTERGVAEVLGMDWIDPIDRQRFVTDQRVVGTEVQVVSSSGSGSYTVSEVDGVWSCTCPHHTYRRVECKHIRQVLLSVAH